MVVTMIGCTQNNWMDWKTQNELWLIQNAKDTSVQVSSTGLQYRIIADPNPTDAKPSAASYVRCDYTCKLINGMQVDGGENVLNLAQTIAGFSEGLKKIHVHGDIELFVPYDLGYGEEPQGTEGTQSYIPPYSTLIFQIHLISLTN
mgnify:CR=1 FL=1